MDIILKHEKHLNVVFFHSKTFTSEWFMVLFVLDVYRLYKCIQQHKSVVSYSYYLHV